MSIFRRSIIFEIISYIGTTFSILLIIWISMLLIRLFGEVAKSRINFSSLFIITNFSTITALPIILSISVFVAILMTVSRSVNEQEMIIWMLSGSFITKWMNPILSISIPVALIIGFLTLFISPWSYGQIENYRKNYENHVNLLKFPEGEFINLNSGNLILFIDKITDKENDLRNIFIRIVSSQWISILKAERIRDLNDQDKRNYITLEQGSRYDMKRTSLESSIAYFNEYRFPIRNKINQELEVKKLKTKSSFKTVRTLKLLKDHTTLSKSQIMWRFSIPISAINLAILALPLGSINFKSRDRRGKNFLISCIIALFYMNQISLFSNWVNLGKLSLISGIFLAHIMPLFLSSLLIYFLFYKKKTAGFSVNF